MHWSEGQSIGSTLRGDLEVRFGFELRLVCRKRFGLSAKASI